MRAGTAKSIWIIAGAALGSVLVGLLGAYFALPAVAPSMVPESESTTQVAAASDSTTDRAPSSDTARAATEGGASTGQQAPTTARDSGKGRPEEASSKKGGDASRATRLRAFRDSIDTLQRRLRETRAAADTLREETAMLREKLAAADAKRTEVTELSDALMDMRRRNLSSLLQNVDMSVLKKLYQETSGRARTRLLQSMAPAQAAQFVNQVVERGVEPSPLAASDSLSAD